jgi:outer membrane protein insertion porin family
MFKRFAFILAAAAVPVPVVAQQPAASANPTTFCGQSIPTPKTLPPENSGPVVFLYGPCFEAQGGVTLIDPLTYIYYMQLKASQPSQGIWVPYTDETEKIILEDFRRLMGTPFIDNLSIDVQDYVFSNGVVGKLVAYNIEERQRVKIVDFVGSKKVDTAKIYEKLQELNTTIRLDTFIDTALVKKVEGIIREMLKAEGFQFSNVTHEVKELPGGPKLVHLTFNLSEGPKVKIRNIDFLGNEAISDGTLKRRMKENKETWFLSFISGRGTYKQNLFEQDAERVLEYYRDRGYIRVNIGEPMMNVLEDDDDGKTRWVELRIPVEEGKRYRIGEFTFEGNKVVPAANLRPFFKLESGDFYNQKEIREGYQKAQEAYGAGGYMDFTMYPDFSFRDEPNPAEPQAPAALAAVKQEDLPAVVDVTMRVQEGTQFFVNRITFAGNTTTRDSVIRRELRLYENRVFDTEALKFSVRRLNQLGYFKPLEGPPTDVTFEKTPGADNKVDVKFNLEEQNRNQLTFGAGVSQYEGFFGQLSFQTANFLGRGESLTVSLQGGSRAQNYTLAFTEPFLFDRNITGGFNLFRQEVRYIGAYTQRSSGGSLTFGFPVGNGFTRMFTNYSYQAVRVTEISDVYLQPEVLARNPFLRDSLLLGQGGVRTISSISPSIVYNTVDQPIFPTTGKRFTATLDLAGLGGNTKYYNPMVEAVWFLRQNARMSLGFRGQYEYIHALGNSDIPIFERLFLGGEYSVRGFDIRQIGPRDPSGLVLGGNKSLLFNVEQIFHIAGPVRLILFYDAGQVQPGPERQTDGTVRPGSSFAMNDFKTSTGAEIRFFMPVLNVPFRLIFAHNPQREGVLDNNFFAQKAFQFRFAVGTTF